MAHEQPAVRTTIVGGRPPGSGQGIGAIPRGIEVLVKKAAVDAAFRTRLLAVRAGAAVDIGLVLAPSEAALLAAVPEAQLAAMISGTRVPERHYAAFLGSAAAVMLAALGLVGCDGQSEAKPAGIRPEPQPPPPAEQPATPQPDPIPTSRGVRPDLPLPAPNPEEVIPTKGIRPDVPPEQQHGPDANRDTGRSSLGIRPDVPMAGVSPTPPPPKPAE